MKKFPLLALCAALLAASCGMNDKKFSLNSVDRITTVELSRDSLFTKLVKTDSGWMVNDEHRAGEEPLDALLFLLNTQAVVSPVPERQALQAQALLEREGIRIRAYEGRTLSLDFTVAATDSLGYIGRVEGKKQLYILQQPDTEEENPFDYLTPLPSFWRHNVVVSALPADIVSVTVDNLDDPEQSFSITRTSDSTLLLTDLYNRQVVTNANLPKLRRYLSYFNGVSYDRMLDLSDEEQKAILLSASPYQLSLATKGGEHVSLQVFYIATGEFDPYGNPLDYDPNKFYLAMNEGQDIALAYWVEFDLLLKNLSDFVEK